MTIEITDPELIAMLERIAIHRRQTTNEIIETWIRLNAMDIDTMHDRRQGKSR